MDDNTDIVELLKISSGETSIGDRLKSKIRNAARNIEEKRFNNKATQDKSEGIDTKPIENYLEFAKKIKDSARNFERDKQKIQVTTTKQTTTVNKGKQSLNVSLFENTLVRDTLERQRQLGNRLSYKEVLSGNFNK